MKDKTILVSVLLFGVLVGFYFMVLSPKREKASKVGDEVTALRSEIEAQKQFVSTAEQTRREFPEYYGRLVVLGKAVPEQADTSSMLVQLSQISSRSDVDFRGLTR